MTCITVILAAGVLFASPALADTPSADEAYAEALEQANTAYNDGDYEAARDAYVAAIQARPDEAVPYRNLARTYFWQSDYAAAVAHYDMYLREAAGADDAEQVRSERRLASSRAGGEPWAMPDSQRMAAEAFEEHLESGSAYTRGGGGAWGLYQTLLRTGYARPELLRLRRRLVTKLLDEFEGQLVTASDQPAPRLDLQAWQLQKKRLESARELTDDEAVLGALQRRALIPEAAMSLLNGQFERAAELAEDASEQNPDMPFVRWLEVAALVEAGAHERALEAVADFEDTLAERAPRQLDYARMVRALVLQRMGRHEEAADIYLGVIGE